MKGFYFITDKGLTKNGIIQDVREAIKGGARLIQYRDKDATTREMIENSIQLKQTGVPLIINDRIDVCLAADASGVHLGQDDMKPEIARRFLPKAIIGVTVHNVEEAVEAESKGADYLGVSPIFTTTTKDDAGEAVGPEMITRIKEKVKLPLAAIGGITLDNVKEVVEAGADMVCAISATVGKDVKKEVETFDGIIRKVKNDAA